MTTTATALLMRDIPQVEGTLNAKALASSSIGAILPMFPLMPVADVLITERRICQACGSIHETPSDRVHRLLSSCEGDPFKRVLRPRKPEETPLDRLAEHTVEVKATHCHVCWQPSHGWGDVWNIEPAKPPRAKPPTVMADAFNRAGEKAMKVAKAAGKSIRSMTAEEAADVL
jgi:hypothetical protein